MVSNKEIHSLDFDICNVRQIRDVTSQNRGIVSTYLLFSDKELFLVIPN